MKNQPAEITVCNLECVLMPNGEIISIGRTIGWFRDYKDYLTAKIKPTSQDELKGYREQLLKKIELLDNPYPCFPDEDVSNPSEEIARHYAFTEAMDLITGLITDTKAD